LSGRFEHKRQKGENVNKKYIFLAVVGTIALAGLLAMNVNAATINVPGDYTTIQDAIDNANDGDTIVVSGGAYQENIVVDKEVSIIGTGTPVIDGMGGIAINITANNVTITGFNITNSSCGINCTASGFYIANNAFWHDEQGFCWYVYEEDLAENYVVYDSTAEGNKFYMNTNNDAIYACVDLDYAQAVQGRTGLTWTAEFMSRR